MMVKYDELGFFAQAGKLFRIRIRNNCLGNMKIPLLIILDLINHLGRGEENWKKTLTTRTA